MFSKGVGSVSDFVLAETAVKLLAIIIKTKAIPKVIVNEPF
jgi:hypothetical protein